MPSQRNIARPYAQALFQLALEEGKLANWNDQLQCLAALADDPQIKELAARPNITSEMISGLIKDILGESLDQHGKNLVQLIVQNGRLSALSEIASGYAELREEAEKTITASMITATPIDEGQRQSFQMALKNKLGRAVELEFKVDEELIGGAVIRAGDWVVDGSVKSQLDRLVGAIGS
ncbi:MAG: F0F1 ATP synthase subunit delta [Gammaproteobacteria bacterium]|nr:F0F1 ATP synthase subunit delta [Gammaproteobacteria bacterium]MCY4219735.1 F0F1 ATP synthase subunit delta [Gammaproteobacteria bacterium]MCY4276198.1 F0F1 ATP synthase subunit delta [Gammaproteobacteria bacterium]